MEVENLLKKQKEERDEEQEKKEKVPEVRVACNLNLSHIKVIIPTQIKKKPDFTPEEEEKMKKRWSVRRGSLPGKVSSGYHPSIIQISSKYHPSIIRVSFGGEAFQVNSHTGPSLQSFLFVKSIAPTSPSWISFLFTKSFAPPNIILMSPLFLIIFF